MARNRIEGTEDSETINGTIRNDEIRAFRGDDTLNRLDGNDELRGDAGNDILTGGDGADRFIFNIRGGIDTVTDYTDEVDRLDFTNFNIEATATDSAFDILISHAEQVGDDTVFTMDGGEVIILEDVLISVLDAGDFRI